MRCRLENSGRCECVWCSETFCRNRVRCECQKMCARLCDEYVSVSGVVNHSDDVTLFSNAEIVTDCRDAQMGSKVGTAGNSSNDDTGSFIRSIIA